MTGRLSRRGLLASAAGSGALLAGARSLSTEDETAGAARAKDRPTRIPFDGRHQAGILTPQQAFAVIAAFDVTAPHAHGLRLLMERWTTSARRLTRGDDPGTGDALPGPADSGEADGLGAKRLTITFGFGPELFDDRFGLQPKAPRHLRALPAFTGDSLQPQWSGGDLVVQLCADDPTVTSHALRWLRRAAGGLATLRWSQSAFLPGAGTRTQRNLFGQVDGQVNPSRPEAGSLVWAGPGEPAWFRGGTYMIVRRIRMHLLAWDELTLSEQERSTGRRRHDGAPLSGGNRDTEPVLARLPRDSHVRLSRSGPGMLRRGYSYDNGAVPTAGPEMASAPPADHSHNAPGHRHDYDAGLMFVAFVRDPGAQFVAVQQKLAARDRLGRFLEHTGSAIVAVPPGASAATFVGRPLLGAPHGEMPHDGGRDHAQHHG